MAARGKSDMSKAIYCCNPFDKLSHKTIKNLRLVQDWMCELRPDLNSTMKICDSCRKQLSNYRKEMEKEEVEKQEDDSEVGFSDPSMCIDYLNKSLTCIEESPIAKKRIHDSNYCNRKLEKAKDSLLKKFVSDEDVDSDSNNSKSADSEMLTQLKEKFVQTQK